MAREIRKKLEEEAGPRPKDLDPSYDEENKRQDEIRAKGYATGRFRLEDTKKNWEELTKKTKGARDAATPEKKKEEQPKQ
jgi:hypothetical protein